MHGSEQNTSGRDRKAFAVHFVRAGFEMQPGAPAPSLVADASGARGLFSSGLSHTLSYPTMQPAIQ